MVTALCRLYLGKVSAVPFSSNSTKLARDTSLPLVSDLTCIFDIPSLFLLSERYCCKIIGYSLPIRLNVVTFFPP